VLVDRDGTWARLIRDARRIERQAGEAISLEDAVEALDLDTGHTGSSDVAANPRARRIDVRVSKQQDAMIREAAALAGKTMTGFVLDAAEECARGVQRTSGPRDEQTRVRGVRGGSRRTG
jgi:hypothetical protein